MLYISTRTPEHAVCAAQAIVEGLAPDGGLYFPETLPAFSAAELDAMIPMSYTERAAVVLDRFLPDFTRDELRADVDAAYSKTAFPPEKVAPVVSLADGSGGHILELFHGPTCAFKDFALQLLPRLLTASLRKTGTDKTAVILVATSGDTGKAALEGFADVPGTKIGVFYPNGGTSAIQRLQMTTQSGGNVAVFATDGNFDDTQNGVKKIFTDTQFAAELSNRGILLSSANSINWGRLAPQIAYYFSAYCDLRGSGAVRDGEPVNIAVPTGNFGNILAAYLAKRCGLPVNRLICASNRNRVLTDFINTGEYNRNREFHLTTSPSMDILISSNLERLLFLLAGRDGARLRTYMDSLAETGSYRLTGPEHSALRDEFSAGSADDNEAAQTIARTFSETGYLCDPHTAVGVKVWQDYREQSGDDTQTIIAATASPFKFAGSVLSALGKESDSSDEFALLDRLAELSGAPVPSALAELKSKKERFTGSIRPDEMCAAVRDWLVK